MNKEKMWEVFRSLGEDVLTMNHYQLSDMTDFSAEEWKAFLLEPDVSSWVATEIKLLQNVELNKLIQNIGDGRSVGQAQLMTALSKLGMTTDIKEGPIFIYTYVPLTIDQEQAENVQILEHDPFLEK